MTPLEQSLLADIPRLNADSQAFMRWILDRVIGIGLKTYGPWNAELDNRDFDKEIADEDSDSVVYRAMQSVKRALAKRRRVDAFNAAALIELADAFNDEAPTLQHARAFLPSAAEQLPAQAGTFSPSANEEPAADPQADRQLADGTILVCPDCHFVGKHEAGCIWTVRVPPESEVAQ